MLMAYEVRCITSYFHKAEYIIRFKPYIIFRQRHIICLPADKNCFLSDVQINLSREPIVELYISKRVNSIYKENGDCFFTKRLHLARRNICMAPGIK